MIPTQGWKASGALGQVVINGFLATLPHTFILSWAMDHQPGSSWGGKNLFILHLGIEEVGPLRHPHETQLCFCVSWTQRDLDL